MANRFASGVKSLKELSTRAEPPPVRSRKESIYPPSRQGRVAISGYYDPVVRKQLAILAAERETSQAALLAEAMNMLFERYGKPPVAKA